MSASTVAGANERPGFASGFKALFTGLWWTIKTPAVWPLAMVPLALGCLLTWVLATVSIGYVPGLVEDSFGDGIGGVVLQILITIVAVLLSALLGFALAQPLSGPALEAIVRRKESDLGAPARPEASILTEIWRSLQSLAVGYAFGLPILTLLFILSFLVPYAEIILFPLKLLVAAFTIAWDICDYPLSMRGLPVSHRVTVLSRNKAAVLGFSLGLALAGLVPCLLFLLLPGGVAGSTRLMWEIEAYERARGADMDGIRRTPGG